MKNFVAACVCLLFLVSSARAGETICSLPGGSDIFLDSEGVGFVFVPADALPHVFVVCGPTTIVRSDPTPGPLPGQCTIETEIVSMSLTGVFDPCDPMNPVLLGPALPITFSIPEVTLPPLPLSTGLVISDLTGGLPAESFFDVFTEVAIGAMPPFVHAVDSIAAVPLNNLPPGSSAPGGEECVKPGEDVYEKGFPAHRHVPCPPKLCCQLPCGFRVHISLESCQRLNGFPTPEHCQPLCPGNVATEQQSWGKVKRLYKEE